MKSIYRCWVGLDNRMAYDGFYIDIEDGSVRFLDLTDGIMDCGEEEPALMQCLGIKDFSKKLIYEGDVISARLIGSNYPINFVVVFNDKLAFKMRFIDRYIKNEGSFYDYDVDPLKYDIFQVVGNIYEHPELIS